jgi:hypothetical protein
LGSKKAVLLQNHGLLTVGQTVDATVFWFTSLEKCCHAQLLADAAAGGKGIETLKIQEEDAAYVLVPSSNLDICVLTFCNRFTYKSVGTPRAGWFSAKPAFDVMIKEIGDEYLQ